MKNIPIYLSALFFCCFIGFSCKKMELKPATDIGGQANLPKNSARLMASGGGGLESADFIPHDEDSIERETVLGYQLTNPYTVSNMQQAYGNLGLNDGLAVVNNKYVRFLPTITQLAALDSIMDAQGLELFDTPVDYQVLYEGDYYQDPSIPDSLPTWQYAVVPPSFQFPTGIQHQTLASIHIPGDNYTAVETEAERLASIQDSINISGMGAMAINKSVIPYSKEGIVHPNVLECGPGYEWSYSLNRCVPILPEDCPFGYHWEDNRCVPDQGGPPPLQPPPAADAAIPAGNIFVHDTNLPSIASGGSDVGVRKVKVIAKRWFKIQTTYTDANGHFAFTKRFKHKVKIKEEFINGDATIFAMRGIMIWQIIHPLKRTLGIYSSDKSNIQFTNNQSGATNSKSNKYWAAATVHNAVQEHSDYATQFGFSKMPSNMHIFLTSWATQAGSASTPMFGHGIGPGISGEAAFTGYYLMSKFKFSPVITSTAALISFRLGIDMALDYVAPSWRDEFYSDYLKALSYHEMSHASDYSKVGINWYQNFVTAELSQSIIHGTHNDPLNPYGDATSADAPIIALGEAWAYHMGHFLADQRYGIHAYNEYEGQIGYRQGPGVHTEIEVIENWNPNFTDDSFNWIPKGLLEDLMDNRNDIQFDASMVDDQVSGFTITQIFNAYQSDVTNLQQYRARFQQQNPGNQSTQITSLFSQYGY